MQVVNCNKAYTALAWQYRAFGLPLEDLTSEALLGLVKAARCFEAEAVRLKSELIDEALAALDRRQRHVVEQHCLDPDPRSLRRDRR